MLSVSAGIVVRFDGKRAGGGVALGSPILAVKVFTSLEGVVLSCFGLIWNTDFVQLVLKLNKCFLLLVCKVTCNFLPV